MAWRFSGKGIQDGSGATLTVGQKVTLTCSAEIVKLSMDQGQSEPQVMLRIGTGHGQYLFVPASDLAPPSP